MTTGAFRKGRHGRRVQQETGGDSLTKQSDTHDADVNVIMSKYMKSGDPSIFMRNTQGIYADVSAMGDYQTCIAIVEQAREAFALLDAPIRDRFGNDPGQLIDAITDPAMKDELTKLGILEDTSKPPAPLAAQTDKKSQDATPAATSAKGS